MPYPNSQTPVTIQLNLLFGNRTPAFVSGALTGLRDFRNVTMGDLAEAYGVTQGAAGKAHVSAWPICQQWQARRAMILALERSIPITFDWQTDSTTSIEIVHFGHSIGMTFHSPLNYPPYWGP